MYAHSRFARARLWAHRGRPLLIMDEIPKNGLVQRKMIPIKRVGFGVALDNAMRTCGPDVGTISKDLNADWILVSKKKRITPAVCRSGLA